MTDRELYLREDLRFTMNVLSGLPIVAMVDSEVCGDEDAFYLGDIKKITVDSYLVAKRTGRVILKSDDDVFETLDMCMSVDEFEALPETEEECRPYYDSLPWKRAIILQIGTMNGGSDA